MATIISHFLNKKKQLENATVPIPIYVLIYV